MASSISSMIDFRKLFNWFLRILLVFPFAIATYFIISSNIGIMNRETLIIGLTAFFGAFFAFGFDRVSLKITAIRKRYSEHFSALVKIERLLNRIIAQLDQDILLAKEDLDALRSMKIIVWNLPPIPFSHDLADDLMNIDFINDYFALTLDLETVNRDLAVIMSMYNESKSLFLGKVMSPEQHKGNVGFTIERLSELIKFMDNFWVSTMKMLATARILLKEQQRKVLLLGARPSKNYAKNMSQQLSQELPILKGEIEQMKKKSQEEIDKIRETRV